MRERRLPRLGLLGLMTGDYEPNFPGITARQEAYVREIVADMADVAEIFFPGAALDRPDIEAYGSGRSAYHPSDLFSRFLDCSRHAE